MTSTVKYWWIILESRLLKIKPIFKVWAFCYATVMTILTMIRYLKGVRERMKMGMTWEQASDRAYRFELQRIDEMVERERNEAYLAQRRIDKIDRELKA